MIALREIVTASADTAHSVRRISDIAQEMIRLSATLKERVGRFTLRTDDAVPLPALADAAAVQGLSTL